MTADPSLLSARARSRARIIVTAFAAFALLLTGVPSAWAEELKPSEEITPTQSDDNLNVDESEASEWIMPAEIPALCIPSDATTSSPSPSESSSTTTSVSPSPTSDESQEASASPEVSESGDPETPDDPTTTPSSDETLDARTGSLDDETEASPSVESRSSEASSSE